MAGTVERLTVAGQPAYCLRNAGGDQLLVLEQGGQVLSWMTADGIERMYLSPLLPAAGQAARGGVPVIFPQFNQRGPDFSVPRHGFARNLPWTLVPSGQADAAELTLRLQDSEATRAHWPLAFVLDLHVRLLPGRLELTLAVENRSAGTMAFTAALHTYLAVSRLQDASLSGLAGVRRLDTILDQPGEGGAEPLRFTGPIDDIYFGLPRPLCLDSGLGRLQIGMAGGFCDTVVWNPGPDGAAGLKDMPDEDWQKMLCIEAAAIGEPVRLAAGARWSGSQLFSAR